MSLFWLLVSIVVIFLFIALFFNDFVKKRTGQYLTLKLLVEFLFIISIVHAVGVYEKQLEFNEKQALIIEENKEIILDNLKTEIMINLAFIEVLKENEEINLNSPAAPTGKFEYHFLEEARVLISDKQLRTKTITMVRGLKNMNVLLDSSGTSFFISDSQIEINSYLKLKKEIFIELYKNQLPSLEGELREMLAQVEELIK